MVVAVATVGVMATVVLVVEPVSAVAALAPARGLKLVLAGKLLSCGRSPRSHSNSNEPAAGRACMQRIGAPGRRPSGPLSPRPLTDALARVPDVLCLCVSVLCLGFLALVHVPRDMSSRCMRCKGRRGTAL